MSKPTTIEDYLQKVPVDSQAFVRRIRRRVQVLVPEAEETISYGMPAFRLGRVFIYFAAFKRHVGVFPPVKGDEALVEDLTPFRGPKGNLKFPYDESISDALLDRVILALREQYAES